MDRHRCLQHLTTDPRGGVGGGGGGGGEGEYRGCRTKGHRSGEPRAIKTENCDNVPLCKPVVGQNIIALDAVPALLRGFFSNLVSVFPTHSTSLSLNFHKIMFNDGMCIKHFLPQLC